MGFFSTKQQTFTNNLIGSLDKVVSSNYSLVVDPDRITLSNVTIIPPSNPDSLSDIVDKTIMDVYGKEATFTYSVIKSGTIIFYNFNW